MADEKMASDLVTNIKTNSPSGSPSNTPNTPNTPVCDKTVKSKTPAWLSCELRLDDFHIKNQTFTISGWINVFWKWTKAPSKLKEFDGYDEFDVTLHQSSNQPGRQSGHIRSPSSNIFNSDYDSKQGEMIMYKNDENNDIIKIRDLRESSISYYLPIDATKIFFQP